MWQAACGLAGNQHCSKANRWGQGIKLFGTSHPSMDCGPMATWLVGMMAAWSAMPRHCLHLMIQIFLPVPCKSQDRGTQINSGEPRNLLHASIGMTLYHTSYIYWGHHCINVNHWLQSPGVLLHLLAANCLLNSHITWLQPSGFFEALHTLPPNTHGSSFLPSLFVFLFAFLAVLAFFLFGPQG